MTPPPSAIGEFYGVHYRIWFQQYDSSEVEPLNDLVQLATTLTGPSYGSIDGSGLQDGGVKLEAEIKHSCAAHSWAVESRTWPKDQEMKRTIADYARKIVYHIHTSSMGFTSS